VAAVIRYLRQVLGIFRGWQLPLHYQELLTIVAWLIVLGAACWFMLYFVQHIPT
jgi:hypothetical protein